MSGATHPIDPANPFLYAFEQFWSKRNPNRKMTESNGYSFFLLDGNREGASPKGVRGPLPHDCQHDLPPIVRAYQWKRHGGFAPARSQQSDLAQIGQNWKNQKQIIWEIKKYRAINGQLNKVNGFIYKTD